MFLGDHIIKPGSGHGQQLPLIAHAAGMVEEVPDGDLFLYVGPPGKVFPDVVVQVQFSLPRQQHDGIGCELFGDRSHVKDGVGADRNPVFEVSHAVSFRKDQTVIADYSYRATRAGSAVPFLKDAVDPIGYGSR